MTDAITFSSVRAQATAVEVLERAIAHDRVAHAYLFDGPAGVGKQRAALALATALLCPEKRGRGCGLCDTCRRIATGNHPDVRVFPPRDEGDRNLQIAFLREQVLPFAQFAPFEARAAVVVFPDADVSFPMNHAESANALLKTLEEPRPNVHFALLSSRADRLLPTIRSRCQRVRFGRLPPVALDRILDERAVPEPRRAAAIALADGSAERAIALAEEGAAAALLDEALRIDGAIEARKPAGVLAAAEALARGDDPVLALDTLATFYRDVAAASLGASDDTLAFRSEATRIRARATTLDAAHASARVALLRRAVTHLERNANAEITLDALLFELGSAR